MKQTWWIPGRMPGRNEQESAARKHRMAAAAMKKKWTLHCRDIFLTKPAKFEMIDIELLHICENKRSDPDNISANIKFILDGAVKASIIKNDGWKQIRRITHRFDVENQKPGVYVTLKGVT